MRIGQLRGYEQLEALVVGYNNVPQLHHPRAALLVNLAQKDWVKGGIEFGGDVFYQHRFAEANCGFQCPR